MGNVPTTNLNAYYATTTPGNTINSGVIDPALQDIVQAINDNFALFSNFINPVSGELLIPDQTIVTRHIRNNAITNPKYAPLSITADKLADGSITLTKLAELVVTAAKIANFTITENKMSDNSVSRRMIQPASVGVTQLDPTLIAPISDAGVQAKFNQIDSDLDMRGINVCSPPYLADFTGTIDSTLAIQAAINDCPAGGRVIIPNGNFKINPYLNFSTVLNRPYGIKLNNDLTLEVNGRLFCNPNNHDEYTFILVSESEKVRIFGSGLIEGDRYTHTGTTGATAHGIEVRASSKVSIVGISVKNCWGDGIYIGDIVGGGKSTDISIDSCYLTDNRRNNISVIQVDGLRITKTSMTKKNNVGSASPDISGIDFEPNSSLQLIKNVIVENCYVDGNYNNDGLKSLTGIGFGAYPSEDVTITKCRFINCGYGGLRFNQIKKGIVSECFFDNISAFYCIESSESTNISLIGNICGDNSTYGGIGCTNTSSIIISDNIGLNNFATFSIYVLSCTNVVISKNECDTSGGSATNSQGSIRAELSTNVKLIANTVKNARSEGIKVFNSSEVVVSENIVVSSGTYAIRLHGGGTLQNIQVIGNIIKDSNTTGATDIGHLYVDRATDVIISGNKFKLSTSAPVSPTYAVRNNAGVNVIITSNDAKGGCSGTTFPSGTEYHVINNVSSSGAFS
jgi:hypothetical protein